MPKAKKIEKQTTIPIIRQVIMEKDGIYYQAMPFKGYKKVYPGEWKCGKCLKGNIRPIIGLYNAPKCKVCGAFVRDIRYNDSYLGGIFNEKVFRYSFKPI
jgi:nitric oxide synthase oxygenase domain/subunit